jgi:hypothetical protein
MLHGLGFITLAGRIVFSNKCARSELRHDFHTVKKSPSNGSRGPQLLEVGFFFLAAVVVRGSYYTLLDRTLGVSDRPLLTVYSVHCPLSVVRGRLDDGHLAYQGDIG